MNNVVDVSITRVELYHLLRFLARKQEKSFLSLILSKSGLEYFVIVWLVNQSFQPLAGLVLCPNCTADT